MTTSDISSVLAAARSGRALSREEALVLASCDDLDRLVPIAEALCLAGHGTRVSYSRKVFIPLTKLCRDVCHYCTFARPPRRGERAYLTLDEVLEIARAGAAAGCREALFTLGDKPELRYAVAREELATLGHATTISYLAEMAGAVLRETGLLPHANPGVVSDDELAALRTVAPSQGIMLETATSRLSERGGPHFGSPDKDPALRLEMIRAAGEQAIPFTSGILIGIGETREECVDSLLAIRDLHREYGHIQEVIVQNFRAKPKTRMADAPEPESIEMAKTVAVARLLLGGHMNLQSPPNLSPLDHKLILRAGINDWGGISPVTKDYVNPEAVWPHLAVLALPTERAVGDKRHRTGKEKRQHCRSQQSCEGQPLPAAHSCP